MNNDQLIYGKNNTQRIVAIEVVDPHVELYIQNEDGTITVKQEPNKYWLLANTPLSKEFATLKGNLHYKYGRQFLERTEFTKWRGIYTKQQKDIYSIWNPQEAIMVKDGYTLFKGMKTSDISVLSFDLETVGTALDLYSKILIIANTFRDSKGIVTRKMFTYDQYSNAAEMLMDWTKWVQDMNPTVICGHNINTFDLPYLQHIADLERIQLNLGRDGSPLHVDGRDSKFRRDGSQFINYKKCKIFGRHIVDTFFLSIKYDVGRKYDNYKLKYIINYEGLEDANRQFYDAALIRNNYTIPEEWSKIKDYAEMDGDDALKLYDLMCPALFYTAQSIPKTYQVIAESASGSQINSLLVRSYLQTGHSIPKTTATKQFEGAISRGEPGIYRNVKKLDISSLYPSIMLQYEVYDKVKDPEANFLKFLQYFTTERLKNKKLGKTDKYFDDLQGSQKILINSGYGFMGAEGLNFNSPDQAEFITMKGREILEQAISWAETRGFIIVNCDTDSISYCKKEMTEITEAEQKEHQNSLNSLYPEKIRFEDDGYFKNVIVVKAKNYVLDDGKKLKIKGSSLKASVKCEALKQFIRDIIQTIIDDKHEYVKLYEQYVKEIVNLKDMTKWCVRKTITDKVLAGEQTAQQKILAAIQGSEDEIQDGDRVYVYYKSDGTMALLDKFDGDYNVDRLLQNLYDTALCFETIIDPKLFINYKLKKNKVLLEQFKSGTV